MNYYNEYDPKAAAWLQALIDAGHIPKGHVDTRSIEDLRPADLAGYTQCHFFAGIGGWSRALQLAGWPSDKPVWTGSCPCQPFSNAGKRKGVADERHLWPVFRDLIAECQPPIVFGEQVASSDGRNWLSSVRAEMEALGYAVGAADLCAAGVGAPHIRQRLWFVGMADTDSNGRQSRSKATENNGYGNSFNADDFWSDSKWIKCRDGRNREIPAEPSFFPLANGIPSRMGRLRGYGNAIVPQVGAIFIKAFMEIKLK